MEFNVIKLPELINWSGNPIEFAFAFTPYGIIQSTQDIRLQITVQVELARGTGIYRDIKTEVLTPDTSGVVRFDISSLVDPYLQYYIPELNTLASGRSDGQSKYFRIKWRQYIGGSLGAENFTSHCIICKGGLPYNGLKHLQFFFDVPLKIIPLNTYQVYDTRQPAFASFLYVDEAAVPSPTFTAIITENNVENEFTHIIDTDLRQGDIFYVPIHKIVNQIASDMITVMHLKFYNDAVEIYDARIDYEDRRYFKYKDLVFLNSYGGIDNIRCVGEIVKSTDYEQTIVGLAATQSNSRNILPSNLMEVSASGRKKVNANTGFVRISDQKLLDALMLNKGCYQVVGNYLMPVIVTKKTLAGPSSMAFLFDAQLEWTEAADERFYGAVNLAIYYPTICPALISFDAVQENGSSIRVSWACPTPYSRIRVKVSNGTPAEDIEATFDGPYGSATIPITFTGDIEVTGRLFCGLISNIDGTNTISLGPATVVEITLQPNRAPVAVLENLYCQVGHTTPQLLAVNLLDNDYDPDGDAFEAVPFSGPTLQGGWVTVAANGRVYYTPPSPTFSFIDIFNYKIREIAGGIESPLVNSIIYMTAGTVSEVIYAKIWYQNPIPVINNGLNTNHVVSVVAIKFFADALCTVPKDVSLSNVSFNYKKRVTRINPNPIPPTVVETDLFVLGAGQQTQIHNDTVFRIVPLGASLYIETTEFILRTGPGYIIA